MAESDPSLLPMTQDHQDRLLTHRVAIVDKLENVEEVIEFMREKDSLPTDSAQEILAKDTPRNRARHLLLLLPRFSEFTYGEFVNALEETQSQPDLYQLLNDNTQEQQEKKLPFLFGQAKHFYLKLKEFHGKKLDKVAQARPVKHDMSSHVQLHLHKHYKQTAEERRGFRELPVLASRAKGTPIQREKLFQQLEKEEESPKVVLLIGSPGSGKTATAYNLLHNHIYGDLYKDQFCFVFFILLRDMARLNPDEKVTLKEFLMSYYGPSTEHVDKVWTFINRHQENVLLIMDGFDEYHPKYTGPFTSADLPTSPSILLDNLINKQLLPGAHVLITARMHCVEQLEDQVDRVVELSGLTKEELQQLIQKRLPSPLAENLFDFIINNDAVAGLCTIPVNAISLIDYVQWKSKDGLTMPDLPKTRASLLFLLTVNLLHKHSATLKDKPSISSKGIVSAKADTLRNLCKMAYEGMVAEDGPKQIFDEEDLTRHGLTVEEVTESGLMTGHITSVADDFGPADKLLLSFLHLTFQEELGSIHAVHNEREKLVSLSKTNDGRWDMLVLLSIGLCADNTCRSLLQTLYSKNDSSNYTELVPHLLQAAWQSPRRYLDDGELWSFTALGESLQYELASDLVKHLATPLNTLNMWDTTLTSAHCNSVVKFLQNVPNNSRFSDVRIMIRLDNQDIVKLLGAGGYTGLTLGEDFTTDKLSAVSQAIDNTSSIQKLTLVGYGVDSPLSPSVWDEFFVTDNNSVQCLGVVQGMFQAELPQSVCTSLSHLHSLHTLDLAGNDMSCRDTVSPLHSLRHLTNIRHLGLDTCNLCASCMPTVVDMMCTTGLLWLNISRNPIGDDGALTLAEGLSHSQCVLSSLIIYQCAITSVGMSVLCHRIKGHRSLRCLNAGDNDFSGSSNLSMLTMSSLIDLSLPDCKLSPEAVCSLLQPLTTNTSPITWLNIDNNDLSSDSVVTRLINVITNNNRLQALCMYNCGLTDIILDRLIIPLSGTHSMKLLDISDNTALTTTAIVNLIQNAHIEHLAISGTDLGDEGWAQAATAVVHNVKLVSILVGDSDKETELNELLQRLQSYPSDGRLKRVIVNGDRATLAGQASTLRQVLPEQVSLSFDTYGHAFYVLSDLLYRDFPTDLTAWLIGAGVPLK